MKTFEELKNIRDKMKSQVGLRSEDNNTTRIVVGMATCGIAAGAKPVLLAFSDLINENDIENVVVTQTGCIGMCMNEPIVEVYAPGKEKVTYIKMDEQKAKRVFEQHIMRGKIVGEYTIQK